MLSTSIKGLLLSSALKPALWPSWRWGCIVILSALLQFSGSVGADANQQGSNQLYNVSVHSADLPAQSYPRTQGSSKTRLRCRSGPQLSAVTGGKLWDVSFLTQRLGQQSSCPHGAIVRTKSLNDEMPGTARPLVSEVPATGNSRAHRKAVGPRSV